MFSKNDLRRTACSTWELFWKLVLFVLTLRQDQAAAATFRQQMFAKTDLCNAACRISKPRDHLRVEIQMYEMLRCLQKLTSAVLPADYPESWDTAIAFKCSSFPMLRCLQKNRPLQCLQNIMDKARISVSEYLIGSYCLILFGLHICISHLIVSYLQWMRRQSCLD